MSILREQMRDFRGFTLIEVICALVLLSFIGLFVSTFLLRGVESYIFVKENSEAYQKAVLAMNRINLELRPLISIGASSSTAITYENRDATGQKIEFRNGAILLDNQVLMGGVDNFTIRYKKDPDSSASNWTVADDLNDLYEIESEITVTFNDVSKTYSTSVYPIYSDKYYGAY